MLEFNAETHTYTLDGKPIPNVTSIISDGEYDAVNESIMDDAKARGTALHKAIQLYERCALDEETLDARIKPRLEQWKEFCRLYNPIKIECELPVYSRKHWFAGTVDYICYIKGNHVLVDWKSSKQSACKANLQTAAYQIACNEFIGLDIDARWAVVLTDDKFEVINYKDKHDGIKFLQKLKEDKNGIR